MMNTLRIGLFIALLITGCGGSSELSRPRRLEHFVNSELDPTVMNIKHDDYIFTSDSTNNSAELTKALAATSDLAINDDITVVVADV